MNQQPKTETLIAFAERLIENNYQGRTHFLGQFLANELATQFPEQFKKIGNHVHICNTNGLRLESNLDRAFNLSNHQMETLYKIFSNSKFYQTDDRNNVTKEQIAHAIFDFCVTVQSSESSKI